MINMPKLKLKLNIVLRTAVFLIQSPASPPPRPLRSASAACGTRGSGLRLEAMAIVSGKGRTTQLGGLPETRDLPTSAPKSQVQRCSLAPVDTQGVTHGKGNHQCSTHSLLSNLSPDPRGETTSCTVKAHFNSFSAEQSGSQKPSQWAGWMRVTKGPA